MPTAIYRTADGVRVPSVTTYLGILNKPALMHWSWQLGVQGLDYRTVRNQAADTGTIVHDLITCDILGQEPDYSHWSPMDIATTQHPWEKWEEWKKDKTLDPIVVEEHLISEEFRFGGTPDRSEERRVGKEC